MKRADTTMAFPHLITLSENQGIILHSFLGPSTLSLTRRPGRHKVNGILVTPRPFGSPYLALVSRPLASVVRQLSCASFV